VCGVTARVMAGWPSRCRRTPVVDPCTHFGDGGTLPGEDSISIATRLPYLRIGLIAIGLLFAALPATAAAAPVTCRGVAATIIGVEGARVPAGTGGNDVIVGTDGDDLILGNGGNDIICGGAGADRIEAGAGNDWVAGEAGDDILLGGSGDDRLDGGAGDDLLRGFSGADVLRGRAGDDSLYGGTGDDRLIGGNGADSLRGRRGDDDLRGGPGDDLLIGDEGNDELDGGSQADRLDGGPDDDVIWEYRRRDTHLAAGTADAAGDVFAYSTIEVAPRDGWLLWRPDPATDFEQGHEGVLTITNLPDGLLMIERVEAERYLLGIAEMPYSWGRVALQSQAIAARTYLASLVANPRYGPMAEYGFDICDWSLCQVYKGTKYGWLEPWEDAVIATEGRILMYDGAPAATFYHSTSGSTTRSIQDVWTSAAPLPYLQAVVVPPQDSVFATWRYSLPVDAFMDVLARDGVTFDGQIAAIRTIKTLPGDGPYRVLIRSTEGTRVFPISTVQQALNNHAIAEYPGYIPPLLKLKSVNQAVLSPTFTVKLRDGDVWVSGQGWGHQIGLSQYGAKALADLGADVDQILGHFYTGLAPEDDPGLIPDQVDVGLFYDNGGRAIVLRPDTRYTLRSGGSVVATGTGGTITITRHGNDAVAVSIDE